MSPQWFSIVVDEPIDEAGRDALAERCRDAAITDGPDQREVLINFDRDAPTLIDDVVSAVRDLDAVGLRAASVRDDGLVTTHTIAEPVGRSPEAVRLWVVGRAGAGSFPGAGRDPVRHGVLPVERGRDLAPGADGCGGGRS